MVNSPPRRLIVPDEAATWNLTAIPAALKIARQESIDVVITTSPPGSVHLVGAAVRRATGARWIADLRDSLLAHQDRRSDTVTVRLKGQTVRAVGGVVARHADACGLGMNLVSDGHHVLLPASAPGLACELREHGFEPVPVDVSELEKAGGSVKCCVLELHS